MTRMKFAIYGVILSSLLFASQALGQVRYMGWNDAHNGDRDQSPDCGQLPDRSTLVVSFEAPEGCTSVQRIEAELDFCTLPDPLPEWWRFDNTAGCRYQAMQVSADFSSGPTAHLNPWANAQADASFEFFPEWQWNPVLAHVVITVTPGELVELNPGDEYYAFQVHFDNTAGTCLGCETPTCFILNSLTVVSYPAAKRCSTIMDYSNYATWKIAHPDCPFIVPARESTWGLIKSLYR